MELRLHAHQSRYEVEELKIVGNIVYLILSILFQLQTYLFLKR